MHNYRQSKVLSLADNGRTGQMGEEGGRGRGEERGRGGREEKEEDGGGRRQGR